MTKPSSETDENCQETPQVVLRRRPFWQKLGGDGLVVSLIFHGFLVFLFGAWVISTITDTAKTDPTTFASGSGGGAAGQRAKSFEHKLQPKNAQNLAKTSARITSKSATSSLALPSLPETSANSLVSGLTNGGSSKGLGGGAGGGIGSGVGVGVGNAKNFVSLFGSKLGSGGLLGEFWDIKLDKDGKPIKHAGPIGDYGYSAAAMVEYLDAIESVIRMNGNTSRALQKYFKAETTLVSSTFVHPYMPASEAPKAFGVEKEVKPVHWLAVYSGKASAPFTDEFRFVGGCDNVIVVLVNGKLVFDGSRRYTQSAPPEKYYTKWKPSTPPIKGAPTGDIRTFNSPAIWGDWVRLRKGEKFDITIILGESGGVYANGLLVDWKTAPWHKDKNSPGPPGGLPPIFQVGPVSPDLAESIQTQSKPHGYVPYFEKDVVFKPERFGSSER